MPPLYDPYVVYDNTQSAYWTSQLFITGSTLLPVAPTDLRGSYMLTRWRRDVAAGTSEDLAEWGIHLAIQAAGTTPLVPLNDAQAAAVEGAFATNFTSAIAPALTQQWHLQDIVWRNWGADMPLDAAGNSKLSPPWRVTTSSVAGSGAGGRLPDQVASTITFRTASRRHWGRAYVGGATLAQVDATSFGQFTTSYVDALAGAYHAFLNAMAALPAITNQWVWSPKYRGALSVNELVVDSVPDVIRRRRAKQTRYRKVYTS